MKLKEWGFMRHKSRKGRPREDSGRDTSHDEPMVSPGPAESRSVDPESLEHRTRTGGWQIVSSKELEDAQPTFMGMLKQTPRYVRVQIYTSHG